MSVILAPIHTAALGNATLRFFRSPLAGPDLPWHVHDDLALASAFRGRSAAISPKADRRAVQG